MRKKRVRNREKQAKNDHFPEDLDVILGLFACDDLPEALELTLLMDAVNHYNVKNGTNFDPETVVLAWYDRQN